MILDQFIDIKISNQGKHFTSLGYLGVKQGMVLNVPWQHLHANSNKLLNCACDNCSKTFTRSLQLLNRQKNHLCYSCAISKKNENIKGNIWGFTSEKCGINHPRWNPNKSEFLKYRSEVYKITRKQDLFLLENYDKPRGMCGVDGAYQLDHITSIKRGFEESISASIIGHISNLQFIPWKANRDKWYK